MVVALWIVNVVLALAFLVAGGAKLIRPREALPSLGMRWTEDFGDASVKAIGAAEVLGAIGLIVPIATGIAPILAPIAAVALTVLMAGAIATHVRRREQFVPPLVLGIIAIGSAILGFLVVLG
ncbi:DoxX family protein [Microbacterium sp.]|uniref:DoxX family protein n=1 Tax=Microbacterium sp. TaxID=51671 RepID=UPI002D7A23BB|nr:DoxX family protein [Microbacterium sp.]HET6299870.1 DoxX family protein [Microbacterium sp.]